MLARIVTLSRPAFLTSRDFLSFFAALGENRTAKRVSPTRTLLVRAPTVTGPLALLSMAIRRAIRRLTRARNRRSPGSEVRSVTRTPRFKADLRSIRDRASTFKEGDVVSVPTTNGEPVVS